MEKGIHISVGEALDFAENSPFPVPEDAYQLFISRKTFSSLRY
jgi:hypothetical protein